MRHIRIIHKLRTCVALLVFAAVVSAAGGLWWANRTGLPDTWRAEIEKALAAQGLPATVRAEGEQIFIDYEALGQGTGYVRPSVLLEFGARST